jgi:hypothetical protein
MMPTPQQWIVAAGLIILGYALMVSACLLASTL